MIREFNADDVNDIMDIWLKATVKAHGFICEKYWNENFAIVKNDYIPHSDTYVYEENGKIDGFISIMKGNFIGAVFVNIDMQLKGIGTALIKFVKNKYDILELSVYKNNAQAVNFYLKNGFVIIKEQIDSKTNETELIMEWKNS